LELGTLAGQLLTLQIQQSLWEWYFSSSLELQMSQKKKIIKVENQIPPTRLDIYLVNSGLGLSRSQIQKLIRTKRISVIGKGIKPAFILIGGEEIVVDIPEKEPLRLIPEDIPLDIRYEDEYLLVVNKPPDMVVHPARGHYSGTLVNAILSHNRKLSSLGGQTRPGIIHRLDKDTSGLLIVAKTDIVHNRLSKALARREIHRHYNALVWGRLPQETGTIEGAIGHNPKDHTKMAVLERGKSARTDYFLIEDFQLLSLVEFKLYTGRTHQIRVHAAHIGHPVFGDPDYGGRDTHLGGIAPERRAISRKLLDLIPRQALHAKRLSFEHPINGNTVEVETKLPEDMIEVIETLRSEIS